jgi:O-antigen/teichoic acid export membrane protein
MPSELIPQTRKSSHLGTLLGKCRKFASFGFWMLFVQGAGMLSGILLVRILTTHEYGLYTLSLTLLGAMSILSDAGISNGVMAEGGKVWKDRKRLGQALATGYLIRKQFAPYSLLVTTPILIYLLREHQATWTQIIAILIGVILTFYTSLSDVILQIAPKLQQQIPQLSRIQVIQAIGRLALILILANLFPLASVAILAAAVTQIWANRQLRKLTAESADTTTPPSPEIRDRIFSIIRRTLPGAIFICISSQITLWLIAFFGSTEAVAEVGALSRLSQIPALYTAIASTLLIPRFARLPSNPELLQRWFGIILGITITFGATVVTTAITIPQIFLLLLGSDYSHLEFELILSLASAAIGVISVITYSLGNCRGWVLNPIISIPLTIVGQIAAIPMVDLGSVQGVLWFGLLGRIAPLLAGIAYLIFMIKRPNSPASATS